MIAHNLFLFWIKGSKETQLSKPFIQLYATWLVSSVFQTHEVLFAILIWFWLTITI